MDNRKWYKKIATIFWWTLTALPLIVVIIYFIGYHLPFNNGMTTSQELINYQGNIEGNFMYYFSDTISIFEDYSISHLNNTLQSALSIIGVGSNSELGVLFGYMLSIQVYHLLFDCLVFFIHLIHNFMDKFNNDMY